MYERDNVLKRIVPFIDKPLIKLITGMRRTGKSSIMKLLVDYLLKSGVDEGRILFVNMESIDNIELKDLLKFHKLVRDKKTVNGKKIYLFIDEVQEIPEWEKLINSFLADDDADIFISGSNSHLLSGEYATLLSGRFSAFQIYPLVYSEFLVFKGVKTGSTEIFNEFLKFGGMPGIHHIEYKQEFIYHYLSGVKDSVVLKDIVMRFKIRDVQLLEKIVLFLADNIGSIFSARSVANYFKSEQRTLGIETVYNYLASLESAFVFSRVQRFDIKGKRLLETNEKYYITDLGIRHTMLGFKYENINAYLENIVYIELLKRGYRVMIGKIDDYEVDFVAEAGDNRIYIQVCYLLADDKTIEREYRPLKMIKDNYPKMILSMDLLPESNNEGINRYYLPDWLLGS